MDPNERKSPFDNLDRDELIKKCKTLLGIAQKAKKAKDDYASEVSALREKLSEFETQKSADKESLKTMQLLVDTLTQNKLDASNKIADLQKLISDGNKRVKTLSERSNQFEIECEAQRRQIKRLTDENAEQEEDLRCLNEKFARVSELSQRQTQELLTLEQSVEKWKQIEADFENLREKNRQLKEKVTKANEEQTTEAINESNQQELEKLKVEIDQLQVESDASKTEIKRLNETSMTANEEIDTKIVLLVKTKNELAKENDELRHKLSKYRTKLIEFNGKVKLLKQSRNVLNDTVLQYATAVSQWQTEIDAASRHLVKQIDILNAERDELRVKLSEKLTSDSIEVDKLRAKLNEKSARVDLLEKQNEDLLTEMRELNDVLKNRGNAISKQSSEIEQLRQTQREQNHRIQQLEESLREKTKAIEQMKSGGDNQSEILSTSTISRADETARMHDIEDSFEEKYNKLRSIAIKLKKKVAEQQATIAKLEATPTSSSVQPPHDDKVSKETETTHLKIQNLKSLQAENDRLMDEIDALKAEKKKFANEVKEMNEKLEQNEEHIKSMRIVEEHEKKTNCALEETIKAKQKEQENLAKESEALKMKLAAVEGELKKRKDEIQQKSTEIESKSSEIVSLKNELSKLKTSMKKNNVLNLEVEAYEKSSKEMALKLETKVMQLAEMEAASMSKESTIKSLRNEIRLLNETIESERQSLTEALQEIVLLRLKLKESNSELNESKETIERLTRDASSIKMDLASLQGEQSQFECDRQKLISKLTTENEQSFGQLISLQEQIREMQTKLSATELELVNVQTEFAGYKVRAQSVLRKNKAKDSSVEEELKEEIEQLTKTNGDLQTKWNLLNEQHRQLNERHVELQKDKQNLHDRCKKLIELLDESREQTEKLQSDCRQLAEDHQEALKAHRLQMNALNGCYKTQIDELKQTHEEEIRQLKTATTASDAINANLLAMKTKENAKMSHQLTTEQQIDLLITERQSGEGSESTSSFPMRKTSRNRRDLIPLDELLSGSFEENDDDDVIEPMPNVEAIKEKLNVQHTRVKHLTALLSEAECDVARMTQMNDVLKEELRRQERSTEREMHMHNLEYMKNVIFKFLTINNADERTHLVPVLNTILKLSADECKQLQMVAGGGGDATQSSWANLLPMW